MKELFTIGYEGSNIDDFVNTLTSAGVSLILDIRDFPGSRKKGFSKNVLAKNLSHYNIEYKHLRGLGDPKPGRLAARAGNFIEFRRIFNTHMETKTALIALNLATELASEGGACLLCYERNPKNCHRLIVASHIISALDIGLAHLGVQKALTLPTKTSRMGQDGRIPITNGYH